MKVAIANVWVTLQSYARSTAKAIIDENGDKSIETFLNGEVIHEKLVKVMNTMHCPLEEKLVTYSTIGYSHTLMRAATAPIVYYVNAGGNIFGFNFNPILPALKPIAEYWSTVNNSYSDFQQVSNSTFSTFLFKFFQDKGMLCPHSDEMEWIGFKLCTYVAMITHNKDYIDKYVYGIVQPLFDKAITMTATENECHEVRKLYKSIIEQCYENYQRHHGDNNGISSAHKSTKETGKKKNTNKGDVPQQIATTVADDAIHELEGLIGLEGVKEEVKKLASFLKIQQERQKHGLPTTTQALHFVFTGNPGTGKTTVARVLGKIIHGFGLLNTPNLVECDRAQLVGGYLGQTAIKTSEVVKSALDGVLFIDEAYTLSRQADESGSDSYGEETINTILKMMEDNRSRLVVIVAGYPALMKDFIQTNPGLESRFTRYIHFDDYSAADMCQILDKLCKEAKYMVSPEACAYVFILFAYMFANRDEKFGNGRLVRNMYEQMVSRQTSRLADRKDQLAIEELTTLIERDVPIELIKNNKNTRDTINNTRWYGTCPKCGKSSTGGLQYLRKRVSCKCGNKFTFP
jgi:AAA+ superfamily predicted ATPase